MSAASNPQSNNPDAHNTAGSSQSGAGSTRGTPYYEKLRRDLREAIQKKRMLDRNMGIFEDSIARFEHSYLEETGAGNIVKGFDNYIKGTGGSSATLTGPGTNSHTRRKSQVKDSDRIFSRSSASYMSAVAAAANTAAEKGSESPGSPSAAETGASESAPRAPSGKKKKKASGGNLADSNGGPGGSGTTPPPPGKRLKISYSRD